ncbi:MAG: hypothetical protein PUE13_00365, partial [Clostridiales bacterium]|nr:hypothetical protein [Clostridiales bacterium]
DAWYNVEITCALSGTISWTVARSDGTPTADGCDMSGSYTDSLYAPPQTSTIELISGGYRCAVSYFDDITVRCAEPSEGAVITKETYSDDFEGGTSSVKGRNAALNSNWRLWSGKAGYDDLAAAGIGDGYNAGTIDGKYLAVEARAEDLSYNSMPTVIYTGAYPSSRGYSVDVDIKTAGGGYGAGIRFMISEDEHSYYELYFPSSRYNSQYVTAVLNKVTNDNGRVELLRDNGTAASDCIKGNVIYRLHLSVFGGKISYSLTSADGADGFNSSGSVTDYCNPLEKGRLGFVATGGNSNYVGYDNFVISAYDPYTEEGAEPDNVIYKNVIAGMTAQNNIFDLSEKYVIRKITAADGTVVKVSEDGVRYIPVGKVSGGKLINTMTNLPCRYISLSNTENAAVYAEMEAVEAIRQNGSMEFSVRLNGADSGFSTELSQTALTISGNNIAANQAYDGNVRLRVYNENCSFSTMFRITSPLAVNISGNTISGSILLGGTLPVLNPIAVIRYVGSNGRVLKTVNASASVNGSKLEFAGEYCPEATEISVIVRDGTNFLSAPLGEYVIR